MNLAACRSLAPRPLAGTWYRAIQPRFWSTVLATAHTGTIPGRFNAGHPARPGFAVLYLAEDHLVALFEVHALLGSPLAGGTYVPNPKQSWTLVNVAVQLHRVADLTRVGQRRLVQTSVQELTGDWRGYLLRNPHPRVAAPHWTNVPSQRLGAALHALPNLEGFLTYSAKIPTRKNLVVFPDKLQPGSSVRFYDPGTGNSFTIP